MCAPLQGIAGGLNNLYGADSAWTDANGALHLRIKKREGRWSCAELEISRSLGYGTYIVTVRDTSQLEPAAVLSMNTFDDFGGEQHFRELDIEMSQVGRCRQQEQRPIWRSAFLHSRQFSPVCSACRYPDAFAPLAIWAREL